MAQNKSIKVLTKTTSANTTYYDMSQDNHKDIITKMEALYLHRQNEPSFHKKS